MAKQSRAKGTVLIKKGWVDSLGELPSAMFGAEYSEGDVISIPVLEWDISTYGFVEISFRPRKAPNWLLRAVIPSQQVVLILGDDPKRPGGLRGLGFAKDEPATSP